MKNFAKLFLTVALFSATLSASAQEAMSNVEISNMYSQQIDIKKSEIVTLKKKQKLDPSNELYLRERKEKEVELETLKAKKKIVDAAIKAENKKNSHEKAAKKAANASVKAAAEAERAEREATMASERAKSVIEENLTFEQAVEFYDNKIDVAKSEISTLKKQKKMEPENVGIDFKLTEKKQELESFKSKKKVALNAVKAEKKRHKTRKSAEQAAIDSDKADKKASEAKADAEKAAAKANMVK